VRVSLFVTCLVDQLWPSVGRSTVEVLRRAGCEVEFEARQTCCGQPAFNSGYRDEARAVGRALLDVYESSRAEAIVLPSGSCAAMVHHLPELFAPGERDHARAEALAARTHELSGFLVRVLGVTDVGASFEGRGTWYTPSRPARSDCADEPRAPLSRTRPRACRGEEAVTPAAASGGTFPVKYPEISTAMPDQKPESVEEAGVAAIVRRRLVPADRRAPRGVP
jgi:L-lactate dehydrogenase complex protein LldE